MPRTSGTNYRDPCCSPEESQVLSKGADALFLHACDMLLHLVHHLSISSTTSHWQSVTSPFTTLPLRVLYIPTHKAAFLSQ